MPAHRLAPLLLAAAALAVAAAATAALPRPDVAACSSPDGLLALARARYPDLLATDRDAKAVAAAAGALIQGEPLLALVVAKYRMSDWSPGWNAWFHQVRLSGTAKLDLW